MSFSLDLATGKLAKKIILLAFPVVLANITLPLQGLIDVAIMGHLDNSNYLNAVGLGTQIFLFLLNSFNFLQYASSGLSAQASGISNSIYLKNILVRGLFIALSIGLLLIISKSLWIYLGEVFFQPKESIKTLMTSYYQVRIWGAPIELAVFVSIGWLAGQGKTKYLLYQQLIISMANILLNLIFVLIFNLDVFGVALGTLIANILGLTYGLFCAKKILNEDNPNGLSFSLSELFNWQEIKRLFSLNRDIFIRTVILVSSMSWIMKLSSMQGELILAANIILIQLIHITSFGLDGVAVAAESLVGKLYGQKNWDLLKKTVIMSVLLSIVLAIFFVLVFMLIKSFFINYMTDLVVIRELASQYYLVVVLIILISVFAYVFDGIMFGLTDNQGIRNSMIFVGIIFFPTSYLLAINYLNYGVWLSMYLLFFLRTICLYYFYKKFLLRVQNG